MSAAVVLGLGQDMGGDDAVGLHVVRALRRGGVLAREVAEASALLPLLEEGRRVVLVDAVVGGGTPGAVLRLACDALRTDVTPLSSHGLGVAEALELGRTLYGDDAVARVTIVAIVIDPAETRGEGLSREVAAAVEVAAALALALATQDEARSVGPDEGALHA